MKKVFLVLGLIGLGFSREVEPILYPKPVSKVEFNLSLGLVDFREKQLDKTYYLRLGGDYRVKYPFLVGGGLKASSSSDVFMLYPDVRVKVRMPTFSTLKLDFLGGASVGHAENKTLKKEKLLSGGFLGSEVLYFVGNASFGVNVSYHVFNDSRFNHLQVGLVVGF